MFVSSIFFFETYIVCCAIHYASTLHPPICCLAIYSDNLNTVEIFNTESPQWVQYPTSIHCWSSHWTWYWSLSLPHPWRVQHYCQCPFLPSFWSTSTDPPINRVPPLHTSSHTGQGVMPMNHFQWHARQSQHDVWSCDKLIHMHAYALSHALAAFTSSTYSSALHSYSRQQNHLDVWEFWIVHWIYISIKWLKFWNYSDI